jgi:hypothetical protein
MDFLFNSKGQHIANRIGDQLHAPSGRNIGHWIDGDEIFIDMKGRYLGEIVNGDRLMYCKASSYRSVNFGNYGNYGNAGNYGNPGNAGSIGLVSGFVDIEPDWL